MKITMALALLLSLGVLAACARATPSPPPPKAIPTPTPVAAPGPAPVATPVATPVAKPKPAGELRIALPSFEQETVDPAHMSVGAIMYSSYIYDFVVGHGADGKASKDTGLARDWQVSPDGKAWTFSLRQGVKFQDGKELTAEDVKFSLERFMKDGPTATRAGLLRKLLQKVSITNPYEVAVKLTEPDFLFFYKLSGFSGSEGLIVPKHYMEQVGEKAFSEKPVGSGPWKFVNRTLGSYITFEAHEQHWRQAPAYKKLTLFLLPEESTRVAGLKTGNADIVEIEPESIAEVKKAGFGVVIIPDVVTPPMVLWKQYDPAFVYYDKRVRQALALSVNQAEVVQYILGETGRASATPWTPAMEGYDPELKPYPYDLAKAKQLLVEAGYPQGFEIKVWSIPRPGYPGPQLAQAFSAYWQALGVKTKIVPAEYGGFSPKFRARPQKFDPPGEAAVMSGTARPDSSVHMTTFYLSADRGGVILAGQAPKLDQLFLQAMGEADPAKRHEIFKEANRYVYNEYILIPSGGVGISFGVNPQKVQQWALPQGYRYMLNPESIIPAQR